MIYCIISLRNKFNNCRAYTFEKMWALYYICSAIVICFATRAHFFWFVGSCSRTFYMGRETFMYLLIIIFLLAIAFLLFISKIMPSIFEFIFGLIKTVFVHIGSLIVSIFKLVINFIKAMLGFSTCKNVDFDKGHYYF